jgi:hypothetical protein
MINPGQDPDLQKYCDLMEEIKRRMAVLNHFTSSQGQALYVPPTVESACLQLEYTDV